MGKIPGLGAPETEGASPAVPEEPVIPPLGERLDYDVSEPDMDEGS